MSGRLQQVVQSYRDALLQQESNASQALEHAYAHTLSQIQPQLDKLYKDIAQRRQNGEDVPASYLYEAQRLQHLKAFITQQVNQFGATAYVTTQQLQHYGAQLGQQSALQQLQATVPQGYHYNFGIPSAKAITDIVGATQKGSPLYDLFNGYGEEAATGVANALVTGLTIGSNPRVVAIQVQQALGISRNRALVISRQELVRAYRSSSLLTMRQNSDVCSGWRWQCAKQARTCPVCLAMDGQVFDLDTDFESHICCRCCPVPITKSWSDILSGMGVNTDDIPETSASDDDYQTGSDWLANQDEATQRQVMGSQAAYDLYASGTPLSKFVGVSHNEDWGSSRYVKSPSQITE